MMMMATPVEELEAVDARAFGQARRRQIEVWNAEGDRVPVSHVGRGRSLFLLCSGPSLGAMQLGLLNRRGVVTLGLNNSPAVLAAQNLAMPDFWCCVDAPGHFIEQIWKDPRVSKFIPFGHLGHRIKARNVATGELVDSAFRVEDLPNVLFYNRSARFDPARFLGQADFNWGCDDKVTDALGHRGSRSVMLVALKLAYALGFGRVILLGADFSMSEGTQNYAFEQDRTPQSVKNNNATYAILNARFEALRPHFDKAGFEVLNATPNSALKAFDSTTFEAAIDAATKEVLEKPIQTGGHYDQ